MSARITTRSLSQGIYSKLQTWLHLNFEVSDFQSHGRGKQQKVDFTIKYNYKNRKFKVTIYQLPETRP